MTFVVSLVWFAMVWFVSFFSSHFVFFSFGLDERRIYDIVLITSSTSTQNVISLQFFNSFS